MVGSVHGGTFGFNDYICHFERRADTIVWDWNQLNTNTDLRMIEGDSFTDAVVTLVVIHVDTMEARVAAVTVAIMIMDVVQVIEILVVGQTPHSGSHCDSGSNGYCGGSNSDGYNGIRDRGNHEYGSPRWAIKLSTFCRSGGAPAGT